MQVKLKWVVSVLLLNGSALQAQHAEHGGVRSDTVQAMGADTLHGGHAMTGALGIPFSREGSGTSWLPDRTPMYMLHGRSGRWDLMLHGNVFAQYIDEGSDRGDAQFGSINWLMGMARREVAGGPLLFRAMLSAEPWTVGKCGYPDLLATGESCNGEPLHDRQHPHDLFMELAVLYQREIGDRVAVELYGGPVAEPALGPTAYPHRLSAFPNPMAPITHHWLDATHITFGAITAGVFGRRWKVEASLFNGREPDEDRADIDFAALLSYSGRISLVPTPYWSLQVSAGRLDDAEFPHDAGFPHDALPQDRGGGSDTRQALGTAGERVDVTRITASAIHQRVLTKRTFLAATLAYGHNIEEGEGTSALLTEASLNIADRHLIAGRFEFVQKTGAVLGLGVPDLSHDVFGVAKASLVYAYEFPARWGWKPGIGGGASINFIPADLEPFYGTRHPGGFLVFASVRPALMSGPGSAGGASNHHGTR